MNIRFTIGDNDFTDELQEAVEDFYKFVIEELNCDYDYHIQKPLRKNSILVGLFNKFIEDKNSPMYGAINRLFYLNKLKHNVKSSTSSLYQNYKSNKLNKENYDNDDALEHYLQIRAYIYDGNDSRFFPNGEDVVLNVISGKTWIV